MAIYFRPSLGRDFFVVLLCGGGRGEDRGGGGGGRGVEKEGERKKRGIVSVGVKNVSANCDKARQKCIVVFLFSFLARFGQ